jgi:hypothetical protein
MTAHPKDGRKNINFQENNNQNDNVHVINSTV